MRKRKKGRKLSRKRDQRKALLKILASQLILRGKIKTTEAKAKEVSRFLEKFVDRAKKNDINARRLLTKLFSPAVVKKLVNEVGARYKERKGGYTRLTKLGQRKSDGAKMAIVELTPLEAQPSTK